MTDYDEKLRNARANPESTLAVLREALDEGVIIPENVLKSSLDSMSTRVSGTKTGALYSGWMSKGHHTGAAAEMIANADETIAVINKTDAFKLLDNTDFQRAYKAAAPEKYATLFDEGTRTGPNSLWDDISQRFARGLSGNVITFTPNADSARVFAQTEFPALLQNTKVSHINGVEKQLFSSAYMDLITNGKMPPEQALAKMNDVLVRHSSVDIIKTYDQLAEILGPTMGHDFRNKTAQNGDFIADMSQKLANTDIPHTPDPARNPASMMAETYNAAADPTAKAGVGWGKKLVGSLPLIGIVVGVGLNGHEATQLHTKLASAIENGNISADALLEYDTILVAHTAQGGDPTVLLGEIGVQMAFNDWADRHGVSGELREALQPSSLGLMLRDGAVHVVGAAKDVASYGAEQAIDGTYGLADNITRGVDHVRDTVNGDLALSKDIYDRLPTLDISQTQDGTLTDGSHPVSQSSDIAAMTLAKAHIVYHTDKMNEPGAEKDYHAEHLQKWEDHFETAFNTAKDSETWPEVTEYIAFHGADNLQDNAAMHDIQNNVANANNPAVSEALPSTYPQQKTGGLSL